ncbi:hypothetical protein OAD62_00035 [Oceanihabitans sp.]|nr:hypothetical protein [Oceanihabitans sp.]
MNSLKKGFKGVLFALIGALVGGTVMFIIGHYNITATVKFLAKIPLIDFSIINEVKESLQLDGALAMFLGPLKGIPYKIYAAYGGALSMNYFVFIAVSVFARGIRFSLNVLICNLFFRIFLKKITLKSKRIILAVIWLIIYIIYFNLMNTAS